MGGGRMVTTRRSKYSVSSGVRGRASYTHLIPHGAAKASSLRLPAFYDAFLNDAEANTLKARDHPLIKLRGVSSSMGQGSYGTIYGIDVTPETLVYLQQLRSLLRRRVQGPMPQVGDRVVMKVSAPRRMPLSSFLIMCLHEATVHKQLSAKNACDKVPGTTADTCVSQHVPKFFFAGHSNQGNMFVTIMSRAPGKTFGAVMRKKSGVASKHRLTALGYVLIEKAIATLWANGVVHADFHSGNIMVDLRTGTITVIDFGFAVVLPKHLHHAVQIRLGQAIRDRVRSLGDIWGSARNQNSLQAYVNTVQHGRGYPAYFPEAKSLKFFYNKLSDSEARQVPMLRAKVWGAASPSSLPRGNVRSWKTLESHALTDLA